MKPKETLSQFDRFLAQRGLSMNAVAIGGAALNLLGVIARATKDLDILHPPLSLEIREASLSFAKQVQDQGEILDADWLNDNPSSLADLLPQGWRDRVQVIYQGEAITLYSLGRVDLLMSKIFALCDREMDLRDCIALNPTEKELDEILPWLTQQDANPGWPTHVRATLDDLRRRLGHGL